MRGLWRDAHPTPVLEAPKPGQDDEVKLDFRNHSNDTNNAGVVIFEGDEPQPAK
jgi:hypothetical protein